MTMHDLATILVLNLLKFPLKLLCMILTYNATLLPIIMNCMDYGNPTFRAYYISVIPHSCASWLYCIAPLTINTLLC